MSIDEFPHSVYTNVLLLDGKIECWKTGTTQADKDIWPFKFRIKPDRLQRLKHTEHKYNYWQMGDYEIITKEWIVKNEFEKQTIFTFHAPQWYKQWEHAEDYRDGRAY